jgi:ParB family transcriptional regulator, chromosome partitioning protein
MNTKVKQMGTLDKLRSLASPKDARVERIPLDDLIPDPKQPRSSFRPVDGQIDPETLAELRHFADDINENGQLQPILYRIVDGQKMIIAGERRWRAKRLNRELGRKDSDTLDAIYRPDMTDEKLRLSQLSENLQREDLTDIDTAKYMKNLLEEFPDLKKKDIGSVFKKNSQYVSRILAMLDPQWNDVIQSGAIQFASLLEQYRPLPDKQKAELRELAKNENRALTSGDIRAAKARAEAEAGQGVATSAQDAHEGGAANDAGTSLVGEGGVVGATNGAGPDSRPIGSPPSGQVKLDSNLADQVSAFLASSAPEGESYKPSADATAKPDRQNQRIKDTGGDAVIPRGPGALSPAIHEKREIKMTIAQLEKLLSHGALEGKGHQVSIMLPVEEVKGALTKVGAPLPDDDSNVVMSLLEAVNKM